MEIQIPVKPSDIREFENKAKNLFAYFEPQPKINTELPPITKGKDFEGLGRIIERNPTDYYSQSAVGWIAVMGCIPYRINLSQLQGLCASASSLGGVLWFDVGTLQFSASREELKYSDVTKKSLVDRINTIIDKYIEHLLSGIDQLTPWARRLRIRHIKSMHLQVPAQLKTLEETYLQFKKDPAFALKSRGWKGKLSSADGFKVSEETRLVFRDEKKLLTGYTLQSGDVIVDPILDVYSARRNLLTQIGDLKVDGIPLVKISTLPWTRPATAPRQIDTARARAECLVLDPANIFADRKSERWTPVTRTPLAQDVYVILDSYTVDGFTDFYESFEADRDILTSPAVGGKMPDIIGYRHTKAKPVDKSKIKGVDYKVWRFEGYIKLLTAHPSVAAGLQARIWSNISAYGVSNKHVETIGQDHPVGVFMTKVLKGAKDYFSIGSAYNAAVYRAFQSILPADNVADREWKKLTLQYPLFSTQGSLSMFGGAHSQDWIDYIKIVDLHREMTENFSDEEQKEAA